MNGSRVTRRGVLKIGGVAAASAMAGIGTAAYAADQPGHRFFAGSYTSSGGPGMLLGTADAGTGALTVQKSSGALADPSWLALGAHALYAISEADGTVSAVDPGTLAVRATKPTGDGPAHVAVHPAGGYLFTSLYEGGATITHPIAADGTVKALSDTRRQSASGKTSNAHQVVADPTGAYLLAVDLGRDTVFTYQLTGPTTGKLKLTRSVALPAGTGPRHLAFHPGGRYAYLAGELGNTVTVCTWQNGVLTPGRAVPAATGSAVRNYPGEIATSADGRFVYVSNRGADTIAVFATGDGSTLTPVAAPTCGGNWPRNLALTPDGAWLYVANQNSGTITWLPVDPTTGVPGAVAGSLRVPGVAQILFA